MKYAITFIISCLIYSTALSGFEGFPITNTLIFPTDTNYFIQLDYAIQERYDAVKLDRFSKRLYGIPYLVFDSYVTNKVIWTNDVTGGTGEYVNVTVSNQNVIVTNGLIYAPFEYTKSDLSTCTGFPFVTRSSLVAMYRDLYHIIPYYARNAPTNNSTMKTWFSLTNSVSTNEFTLAYTNQVTDFFNYLNIGLAWDVTTNWAGVARDAALPDVNCYWTKETSKEKLWLMYNVAYTTNGWSHLYNPVDIGGDPISIGYNSDSNNLPVVRYIIGGTNVFLGAKSLSVTGRVYTAPAYSTKGSYVTEVESISITSTNDIPLTNLFGLVEGMAIDNADFNNTNDSIAIMYTNGLTLHMNAYILTSGQEYLAGLLTIEPAMLNEMYYCLRNLRWTRPVDRVWTNGSKLTASGFEIITNSLQDVIDIQNISWQQKIASNLWSVFNLDTIEISAVATMVTNAGPNDTYTVTGSRNFPSYLGITNVYTNIQHDVELYFKFGSSGLNDWYIMKDFDSVISDDTMETNKFVKVYSSGLVYDSDFYYDCVALHSNSLNPALSLPGTWPIDLSAGGTFRIEYFRALDPEWYINWNFEYK